MAEDSHMGQVHVEEPSLLIGQALQKLQDGVVMVTFSIRQRVVQSFILFSVIFLLLWISAFLYGSFYYSYMPKAAFSTPVHYYYRTDCESPASFRCSYPVANISLMRNKKHVLTLGQPYRISLQLEMPDSPVNQELGMFMIRASCYSRDGGPVASSARSAKQLLSASGSRFSMLRYRSSLLRHLATLLLLPAFLSGAVEEKQTLEVELFSEYIDDPYKPSVTAVIEILSNRVQIYSSRLHVHAHFSGIRYLLFNFPLISALVGVSSNFIFLGLLFLLSYLRVLLRGKPVPASLRGDRVVSQMDNNVSSSLQDEDRDAGDSPEQLGPVQTNPTDPQPEEQSTQTHGPAERSETEAA